jgi:hypothetical protein
MTDSSETPINENTLLEAAKRAVEAGKDVQRAIRDLALEALGQGRLTAERTRTVVRAVAEGAARGAAQESAELKESLAKAMAGLDEALGMTATASRLAIEEAARNLKEFTSSDLQRAVDDLIALEQLFIESVTEAGRRAKGAGSGMLHDLMAHARRRGTAVGRKGRDAAEGLREQLARSAAKGVRASKDVAIAVSARLARSASDILGGLAEKLEAEQKAAQDRKAPAAPPDEPREAT